MKIAFLGDSITLGYALENRMENRFSAIFCREHGHTEVNLGITGTLVAKAGLSEANGTSYIERYELMKNSDFAVVFGGTNDYFWSNAPIRGNEGDRNFENALETICKGLLGMFERGNILFITPYPHHGIGNFIGGAEFTESSEHDTDLVNFVGHTLSDYSDTICSVCGKYGIAVLDLRGGEIPFDWKSMTIDGCHPNEAGHRWLADRLSEKID